MARSAWGGMKSINQSINQNFLSGVINRATSKPLWGLDKTTKLRNKVRIRLAKQMCFQSFTKSGQCWWRCHIVRQTVPCSSSSNIKCFTANSSLDSLNGGTTRRSVLAERRRRRPGISDTERADLSNVVQSHAELYTSARQSWTGYAPGRAASVNWQACQLCGRSDVAERSSVQTH